MPGAPLLVEKTFILSLSPDDAWKLISDTDRMNRWLGLAKVHAGETLGDEKGKYRRVWANYYGLRLRWREYPFEWWSNRGYSVLREYEGGPFHSMKTEVTMSPVDGGVQIRAVFELVKRWPVPDAVFRMGTVYAISRIARYFKESQRTLRTAKVSYDEEGVLQQALSQMDWSALEETIRPKFYAHLLHGTDSDVLGMRPFELADRWEVPRLECLRVFLEAARRGVLDLDWELMCPNCRVPKAKFSRLKDVTETVHCDVCQIDFSLEWDRQVELRFGISPRLREATLAEYCLGSPARLPLILAQFAVAPGKSYEADIEEASSPTRLRIAGTGEGCEVIRSNKKAPPEIEVAWDGNSWSCSSLVMGKANGKVWITNKTRKPILVAWEESAEDATAVTAHLVTTMDEFRRYFSSEVLAPDRKIAVRGVTILFTDLKNSTVLYEAIGDAPAYSRVSRHFTYLESHIASNGGAVVKTMGDAVMAAFTRPASALACAVAIQSGIKTFNDSLDYDPPITLRLGLHHGPALVIQNGETIDYFGGTVNMAARAHSLADAGEIVLSEAVSQDFAVRKFFAELGLKGRPFSAELKGLGKRHLVRVSLGGSLQRLARLRKLR